MREPRKTHVSRVRKGVQVKIDRRVREPEKSAYNPVPTGAVPPSISLRVENLNALNTHLAIVANSLVIAIDAVFRRQDFDN